MALEIEIKLIATCERCTKKTARTHRQTVADLYAEQRGKGAIPQFTEHLHAEGWKIGRDGQDYRFRCPECYERA